MSCRVDTSPLISGSCVVSAYSGLGITGAALRTATATGGSGAGLLYNDWDSGDDSKQFRALLVTAPSAGTLTLNEDGSFSLTGAADGSYSLVYRLFVDGADLGTASASITVGTAGVFTIAPAGIPGAMAFGLPAATFSVGSSFAVSATGIPAALQFGVASASFVVPATFSVAPSGIASSLAFGSASLSFQYGDSMEPVTVAEAKVAARYDLDELDELIAGVISAARKQAEHVTQRVYKRREFVFETDEWPEDGYRYPVFEPDLCSIRYYNEARTWVDMSPSAFEFAPIGSGAEIAPALDTTWPVLGRRAVGARVRVTFTAGPTSRDDVDEQVKLYIKASVSAWINNPDAVQAKALTLSPLFEHLLDEQRVYG